MKKQVTLKKNEEHRILAGHQWVFSNEIASIEGSPEIGDVVELVSSQKKFMGVGFFHPHSLISVRLLSREREEISFDFFERRIGRAFSLRRRIHPQSETFRMVYGESDFLPGLIIDKYNEYIAIQTLSYGMDKRLRLVCDVLESLFHPKAIVERNDSGLRLLEHLPEQKGILRGTLDETIISENGVKFKVDLLKGQKTGFFLDQRENRKTIRRYVKDADVLDCFCNEGGFSLNAEAGKAKSVHGIDESAAAIARAKVNGTINESNGVSFEATEAFEFLAKAVENSNRYEAVILDPPSFARSKKNISTALKGYRQINTAALTLINPGGFLISASCSHHVTEEAFLLTIEESGRRARRTLQLLEFAGAGPDHPVLPAMPETKYLKFSVFGVQ